jgi:beta-lactamase superfamily II metal-dependent hydrolase
MNPFVAVLTAILILAASYCLAEPRIHKTDKALEIYFLDMEGGASTLIVTPLGESVLIDTGSREPMHRDAERILRACKEAGLEKIDYLVTTHFHLDHFGGILEISKKIPIQTFLDKGTLPPKDEQDTDWFRELYPLYQQATKGKTQTIRAGDDVPLKNDPAGNLPAIRLYCVAVGKKVEGFDGDVDAPVGGFEIRKPDPEDNAGSIALVLTYGDFVFFASGDITFNVEHHLAHPVNRVGKVDLYQITHHGLDLSNNPILLKALSPTVCVAGNGPDKGIQPNTFKALKSLASVKAIYQIHYNTRYGPEGNTDPQFIANPPQDPQKGRYIKVSVQPQKNTFSVSVQPDGETKSFPIQTNERVKSELKCL